MIFHFHKYQGTGNDFIVIDNRKLLFPKDNLKLIQQLCHRKWGIGADGLMLIENDEEDDFEMLFFNPDGSKSLCGNGSRCAVSFARSLGLFSDETQFITTDGHHRAFLKDGNIHFQIHDIAEIETKGEHDYFLNNGSPHHVRFVPDVDKIQIMEEGPKIRFDQSYAPHGTNVNFVSIDEDQLRVRTFERGVENETLSCGTGVVASAVISSLKGLRSPVTVNTKGGKLLVFFDQSGEKYTNIYLAGPAKRVFEGEIDTDLLT